MSVQLGNHLERVHHYFASGLWQFEDSFDKRMIILTLANKKNHSHLVRVHHCFASGAWQTKMNLWTANAVWLSFYYFLA